MAGEDRAWRLATLVVCFILLRQLSLANASCTSGFMQLDLLARRAEKLTSYNHVSTNDLDGEFRLMPDLNFTCAGTITDLFLGADVRTADSTRNQYPEVQLWRTTNGMEYNKTVSSNITLFPGTFSADGVLRYTLLHPLPFQSGDVLGVYQPPDAMSVARLFYANDTGAPVAYSLTHNPLLSVTVGKSTSKILAQRVLLGIETNSSECVSDSFLNFQSLKKKTQDVNINSVSTINRRQLVFPDIKFTCNGVITKWIVGIKDDRDDNDEDSPSPTNSWQLQVLRATGEPNTYLRVDFTKIESLSGHGLFNLTVDHPLEVKKGDVLGVYYHRFSNRVSLYNQNTTGPQNYYYMGVDHRLNNPLTEDIFSVIPVPVYYYPLVTVEIGQVPTVTTSPSADLTSTITIDHNGSTSNTIDGITTIIICATAAFIALVLLLLGSLWSLMIFVYMKKRKRLQTTSGFELRPTAEPASGISNPLFTSGPKTRSNGDHYGADVTFTNETSISGRPRIYEQSLPTLPPRSSHYWGEVVPTMELRNKMMLDYELGEELYTSIDKNKSQDTFFQEADDYWEPANDPATIFEQLARQKFREIYREHIRIGDFLGSGQFGKVNRGLWYSAEGNIEVAVKTLKNEATEEETVKFLQEAAIQGQFQHPNIVKLIGVVTVGQPPMIILEFITNGDLHSYLATLKPAPGEIAPSSLPPQLLGYCRQIASGMEYLSKKSFVHRDLAARNILVDGKKCKIADFGMSRDLYDSDYYLSHGGKIPIKWTAPEAFHYKKYSTASDVWSFGVVMYEIWSLGHKPFEGKTNEDYVRLVDGGYRLSPPPGCPRAVYEIMIHCWHPKPSERPSFDSLVATLSQSDRQLLLWIEENKNVNDTKSMMLGAPLEAGFALHDELQEIYI